MKREHILMFLVGLFVLAYVLDAVVNSLALSLKLSTPYHYFDPEIISRYAFSTLSIILKALGLLIGIPLLLSMLGIKPLVKGLSLFVISGLLQLYALQDVTTHSQVIPLEWSISLTLAGLLLLIPGIFYLVMGLFKKSNDSYIVSQKKNS